MFDITKIYENCLDGVSGMESAHPGLIEIGAKSPIQLQPVQQPAVIDERINPQRSVNTNTPEYDQVNYFFFSLFFF